MPKWFARLFAVLMVIACGLTAWYAYQHEKLTFALEDVRVSLETSQARERKQQYEYDEVTKALPAAQKELEEILHSGEKAIRNDETLRATILDDAKTNAREFFEVLLRSSGFEKIVIKFVTPLRNVVAEDR